MRRPRALQGSEALIAHAANLGELGQAILDKRGCDQ
jgi:hypothetical protein